MAFFDFIENFFFISLGITFGLILLLVYHFKQRISSMERKGDTMYELMTNVVKELQIMKKLNVYYETLFNGGCVSEELSQLETNSDEPSIKGQTPPPSVNSLECPYSISNEPIQIILNETSDESIQLSNRKSELGTPSKIVVSDEESDEEESDEEDSDSDASSTSSEYETDNDEPPGFMVESDKTTEDEHLDLSSENVVVDLGTSIPASLSIQSFSDFVSAIDETEMVIVAIVSENKN